MSKKKYNWGKNKEVGCNTVRGWLVSAEEIALIRHYLFLAGIQFQRDAKMSLRHGMPKHLVMHEWRKYKEVVRLRADLNERMPHAYVRA